MIKRYGIFYLQPSGEQLFIYSSKEKGDEVWNTYSEHIRKVWDFKKVIVTMEVEEE